MKYLILVSLIFAVVSCSDADRAAISGLGKTREVKCYSGGKLIFEGKTTGKIENESGSDGYYFKTTTGELIEVNGDCVFRYIE